MIFFVKGPTPSSCWRQILAEATSHFIWKEMPWIPLAPLPVNCWNNTSAKRTRSAPTVMVFTSEILPPFGHPAVRYKSQSISSTKL